MSAICYNCGKTTVMGRTQRHHRGVAGKRWRKRAQVTIRTFSPNLQKATLILEGERVQTKLCAKCIKKFKDLGMLASQKSKSIESLLASSTNK